jgi:hypothetical protein
MIDDRADQLRAVLGAIAETSESLLSAQDVARDALAAALLAGIETAEGRELRRSLSEQYYRATETVEERGRAWRTAVGAYRDVTSIRLDESEREPGMD